MNDTELIDYFKSLGIREILGLVKKSIQITSYNETLEDKLDDIQVIAEADLQENHCANCDGVGLPECQNDKCSTYQMNEILKILERCL